MSKNQVFATTMNGFYYHMIASLNFNKSLIAITVNSLKKYESTENLRPYYKRKLI